MDDGAERQARQTLCVGPAKLGAPLVTPGGCAALPAGLLARGWAREAGLLRCSAQVLSGLPSYPRGAPPSSPAQQHRRALLRPVTAAASPPMIPAPTRAQPACYSSIERGRSRPRSRCGPAGRGCARGTGGGGLSSTPSMARGCGDEFKRRLGKSLRRTGWKPVASKV